MTFHKPYTHYKSQFHYNTVFTFLKSTDLFPNVVDYGGLDEDQLNELRDLADQKRKEEEEKLDKKAKKKKKKKKSKMKTIKVRALMSCLFKIWNYSEFSFDQ